MLSNHLKKNNSIWQVNCLLLIIKAIRSYRKQNNLSLKISLEENYLEITENWKDQKNFDFNLFLWPLTKSKIFLEKKEIPKNSCSLFDIHPFGLLKIVQEKNNKEKLTKTLEFYQSEYERSYNLLTNETFITKAPEWLRKKEEEKLNYYRQQKEKILKIL